MGELGGGGLFEAHERSGAGHDWTAAHAVR
jgi:hypothetical protein